jgi:hypothetical protein
MLKSSIEPTTRTPVTVALVDDYDIVVMGLEHILDQYHDRVVIAELDTNVSVSDLVDLSLSGAHSEQVGFLFAISRGRPAGQSQASVRSRR